MPAGRAFSVTFASLLCTGERASGACGTGCPTSNGTVVDGSEETALRPSSLVGRSNITEDCAAGGFAANQSLLANLVRNPDLSLAE